MRSKAVIQMLLPDYKPAHGYGIRSLFLLLFFVLGGCFNPGELANRNMAGNYRPLDGQSLSAEVTIRQVNDSLARVLIRIKPDEYLYVRQEDNRYLATVGIHLQLVESYDVPTRYDSAVARYTMDMTEKGKARIFEVELPVHRKGTILLETVITDEGKGASATFFIPFAHLTSQSRQCFWATLPDGTPFFRDHVKANDSLRIYYQDTSTGYLWCHYYKKDFPLANPPFSFDAREPFDYHADSVFRYDLQEHPVLTLNRRGFYHFRIDTTRKEGFTIFRFGEDHPQVSDVDQMLEALRYLTTRKEYEELKSNPHPRQAVDGFWIERGGNEERTRMLIRKYYTRVQDANRFFSSYTEGWRTDRGMIYVVLGVPNTIYRSAQSETWIYGTVNNPVSINFFFTKVDNPFTENDYALSRSPIYETSWFRAVDVWRSGRVYNNMY